MKLRIRGNSLRLRLSRGEVTELADRGRIDDAIVFGSSPEARLGYSAVCADGVSVLSARIGAASIGVTLPASLARAWAASDDVGLEAEQPIGDGEVLRLLVEKDFACLTARTGEDDGDAFPNPNVSC
jgi:hypothetical protein